MIKDIREINFPEYATLDQATASISDMGDRTISAQVKIDGSIVPDFSFDWEVEFKGERYIHPVREPQGLKDNTSRKSKIDMTFYHWAIYEMKREFFMEMASITAGTAVADKYIASLGLNLGDFVAAFNLVLNHYFGGKIVMKLNPDWQYATEASLMSISYSYVWDVLQQIHEIYGVRWTLKTNAEGVCEILAGYPAEEVSHIFEYGFEGGLLSVQRQVQSTNIRNRLLGRGGEKNLPYRYFKDADPNNPLFKADPDWVPELANIAFTELRGKTFRDYVKGWKAKHYNGSVMDQPTEAYLAGYKASKFDPMEYVEDKDSIGKYGVLVGALENNEEIYPSIQGAPGNVDAIIAAEQVTDDDVDSAVENDSVTTNLESGHQTYRNAPANSTITIETLTKRYFSVPEGKVGNLSMSLTATGKYSNFGDYEETHPVLKADTVKVTIYDKITGVEVKSSSVPVVDIPAGDYYYMISADVETNYDDITMVTLNIESVYLYTSTPNKSEGWKQTFDIWVRNIWGSSRNADETDQQYADRVWAPILGDRMGGEARVVFATGWLSFSSDWEFPIVGYAFDSSKSGSEWRLTLAKSEAELEASGKYIPYEGYNASAGDKFFFIGIDMPYEYVVWAEERLDDYKRDALLQSANINPTWVIKTDKVRLNQERLNESDEKVKLIDDLKIGSQIRLASKQFISGAYETLYVQSMTYSWQADTLLHPDIEIVVSDKVASVKNPVAQIQSNIESIQRQVGSLSNIQQIIRQVCDKLYLRKDGFSDISKSPTRFLGKISGENFRPGQIGGRDWGIYRDENGNAILEADKFVARQGILVNELIVSEATYVGGLQINSAASMNITVVEETGDGYVCFFDQKQGTVTNKFVVDDVVLCQRFDADQTVVKFYKARVTAVSEDSVTLSKTEVNGTGIPAVDDAIIQYGNYSDKTRQYVIVRDVIGGGYERMLLGLDSVESDGIEYYFAGKSADSTARWFVGGTEQFAEYKDGQLTIKGNIFVTGSDKNISEQLAQIDFIREAFGENAQGLVLGTAIIVGYTDENENFVPMAGLSGVYDKDAENGGPAAWYGGTPDDAKSVIFMDGTGYFADGLFKWDKDKGVNLGNGAIKINYDGSVEFGRDIKIGGTGEETLDSLLTAVATLFDIWKIDKETGNLVTERNVVIKKNLTVYEDMSSGSDGDPSTNTGLNKEELQEYLDENNYVTETRVQEMIDEVTAGDVELTNYYTKKEVDDLVDPLRKDVEDIAAVLGIDEEAEGYINTWAEVKAFLDGYQNSDDLAVILSGINAEVAKNATAILGIDERLKVEEGVTETYSQWWADLKKHISINAADAVTIDTDLIVSGDVASGDDGQGTAASGTVTGVKVGDDTYAEDYITAGILDLTDAFNKIDVSDQLADYLPLSGGKLESHSTNVLTLNSQSPSDTGVYLRMEHNGEKVGEFGCGWGLGTYILANYHTLRLTNDGVGYIDTHPLLHSGNYATEIGDYYLKRTGGIIDGDTNTPLTINTSNDKEIGVRLSMSNNAMAWIGYTPTSGVYLYLYEGMRRLGIKDDGTPYYYSGAEFPLIHTGNIREYNAGGLAHSNGTVGAVVNSSGNVTIGDTDLASTKYKIAVDGSLAMFGTGNATFPSWIRSNSTNGLEFLIGVDANNNKTGLLIGWRNWVDIAMAITPSGFVGIGTNDPQYTLDVNGAINTNSRVNAPYVFLGNGIEGIYLADNVISWHDASYTWVKTIIDFSDGLIKLAQPTTIQKTLEVSGKTTISNDLVVTGDVASGGSGESTDAVGTITGVKVNSAVYGDDYISAGILDLTDAFNAIDVSDQLANYLPKSGGTMTGTIEYLGNEPLFSLYRSNGGTPYIRFGASSTELYGEIGVTKYGQVALWSYVNTSSAYNKWCDILHSGNIGNYAPIWDANNNITLKNELFLKHNMAIRMATSEGKNLNVLFTYNSSLRLGYDADTVDIKQGKIFVNSESVGILTSEPKHALHVNGTARATALYSEAIGIECDVDGNTSGYGSEINRFGGNLYLQHRAGDLYLSHAAGSTKVLGTLDAHEMLGVYTTDNTFRFTAYNPDSVARLYSYNPTTSGYGDLWIGHNSSRALVVKGGYYVGVGADPSGNYNFEVTGNAYISSTLAVSSHITTPRINSKGGLDLTAGNGASASRLWLTTNCFRPWGDDHGLIDLGLPTIRWRNFYATMGDFSDSVTISGDLSVGDEIALGNNKAVLFKTKAGKLVNGIFVGSDDILVVGYDNVKGVTLNNNTRVNGDIVVTGDVSSGGGGTSTDAVGTITGIKVNGQTYDEPVAGILTIPDYPTSLTWSAIDGKPTKLSDFTDDVVSGKYLSLAGGKLTSGGTDVLTLNSTFGDTSTAGTYLRIEHKGTKVGEFGHGWGMGTYMLANTHVIKLLNDGTAYVDDSKIVTAKGESSQFIKGNGSLDSNKYVKTYGESEGGNNIDLNTIVNTSIIGVSNATNGPYTSGNAWASLITMPYRTAYANTTIDFAAQLLIPNGDSASPNMYFRTGLRTSWNAWRKVLDNENFSAHALSLADGGTVAGSVTFSKTVQLSNEIQLGNNKAVLFRNASGKAVNGFFVGPTDILYVGYDNISEVAFRFPVTISSTLTTTERMFAPYLFLGKGQEGIYVTNTGIHWHNSEHAWSANLISLAKNSITLGQPTTVSGSFKATSLRSGSIGIECGADGTTGNYGSEINRFGASLYLQTREGNLYLSHAAGLTAIRGNVTIDKDLTVTGAIIGTDGIDLCGLGASAESSRLFLTTGTFRPWSDDAEKISLGTASVRWHTLFAKDTNLSGALSVGGASTLTGAVTMSSTLTVAQKLQCNRPIFGYMYGYNSNAAAFIFDKPGSNYTGIGSDGTSNTIRLSACNGDGGWVDYAQKWKFYGDIVVTGDVSTGGSGGGSSSTDSNCLGPVALDMQGISYLGTRTKSEMASMGLTDAVITNMFAGLYTKVVAWDGNEVYDYTCFGTLTSCKIFLRQGNGESIDYTYTLSLSGSTWTITEN